MIATNGYSPEDDFEELTFAAGDVINVIEPNEDDEELVCFFKTFVNFIDLGL